MILEIAYLALCALMLVVMPIAFTYGCWRFWYDARWWLVVGATGAHASIFRLIKPDEPLAHYLLQGACLILGLVIAIRSWRELVSLRPQPARRKELTNWANLYGVKRRWRGLEPDFLLRPRLIAALKGRRT